MLACKMRPEQMQVLYDLSLAFGGSLDLDELIPTVVSRCREVLGAEGSSVLLLDETANELFFPYVSEQDPRVEERLAGLRFPADKGVAGEVVRTGRSLHVKNAAEDERVYRGIDDATGVQTREILAAPLRTKRGVIGVLEVINPTGRPSFGADEQSFLEALAGSVAIAIDNARLHAELKAREARLRKEVGTLRRDLARRVSFADMIGTSLPMRQLFRLVESAASTTIAVLIEGETGTGKELVARAIHRASDRADGPLVAVNTAALSTELLESELFGHVRGAFTGAVKNRIGLFEAADGGTIFLDEIADLPLALQVKLLRVLQESEVTPVGATVPRRIDVRVISATNANLQAAVEAGRFRDDLYYRLGAFPISVPPLRERLDDLPLLIDHFVAQAAGRHRKRIPGITPRAHALLCAHRWPGNVRELENEIERAVALTPDGELVDVDAFSPRLRAAKSYENGSISLDLSGEDPAVGSVQRAGDRPQDVPPLQLAAARERFEKDFIAQALARNGDNVTKTARELGVSRVTLQKKLRALGLR